MSRLQLADALAWQAFCRLARILAGDQPTEAALQQVVQELAASTRLAVVAIELYDRESKAMVLKAECGLSKDGQLRDIEAPEDFVVSGAVAQTRAPCIETFTDESLMEPFYGFHPVGTYAGFPLQSSGNFHGALSFVSPETLQVDDDFRTWAGGAACLIGSYLERESAARRLALTNQKLLQLPTLDEKTQLPNAWLCRLLLEQAVARSRRNRETLVLLLLDMDGFGAFREDAGRAEAEKAIQEMADRLRRNARGDDSVSRLEDDEFLWILSNVNDIEDIGIVAERVLALLRRPFIAGGQERSLTASAGISVYPYDAWEAETLLRRARQALSRARAFGPGQYALCSGQLAAAISKQLLFRRQLQTAIDQNRFLLHFQPVAETATQNLIGVEALIRLRNPDGTLSLPADFLDEMGKIEMAASLDEWVLQSVCAQAQEWESACGRSPRISVNLSRQTLRQSDVAWRLTETLGQAGIGPDLLEVDIGQSIIMEDPEAIAPVLQQLKESGISVAIDDFGPGILSLGYLSLLPVDTWKLDASILGDLAGNQSLLSAIISMGHAYNVRVVAEAVETDEQLAFLKSRNCDAFQGFLYCAPAEPDKIRALLLKEQQTDGGTGIGRRQRATTESPGMPASARMKPAPAGSAHPLSCQKCGKVYEALQAEWCNCLAATSTLVCPRCNECFCDASVEFKLRFWMDAPQSLWSAREKREDESESIPINKTPSEIGRPLILVADDEPAILSRAFSAISQTGYGVIVAKNGIEALELALQYVPEVILADDVMPGLDGHQLCSRVKVDPAFSQTKVLLALSQEPPRDAIPPDGWLLKPVRAARLRTALERLLHS